MTLVAKMPSPKDRRPFLTRFGGGSASGAEGSKLSAFAAMDLGRLHTSLAVWRERQPVALALFQATSCSELAGNMAQHLDELKPCSHLFCEQQMTNNFKAQQIQGWVEMWLHSNLPGCRFVLFPARLKYALAGEACRGLSYSRRKSWAVVRARGYLAAWPDQLKRFAGFRPQADVADAVVIGETMLAEHAPRAKRVRAKKVPVGVEPAARKPRVKKAKPTANKPRGKPDAKHAAGKK